MRKHLEIFGRRWGFYLGLTAGSLSAGIVCLHAGQLELAGTSYAPDVAFPQFMHLWSENWGLRGEDGEPKPYARNSMPLGAYLHIFVRNTGTAKTRVSDIRFAGVSLTEAIAFSDHKAGRRHPANIRFAKLKETEMQRLITGGEPIWWKVDPMEIPGGGFAEVVIRLRRQGKAPSSIEIMTDQGSVEAQIPPQTSLRFESISFSGALDTIYAYVKMPRAETGSPNEIFLDGQKVTSQARIFADPGVDICPIVVRLAKPLIKGSAHFLRTSFAHGATADAFVRVWSDNLVYGMWGYVNKGDTPEARVKYFIDDLQRHNINTVMHSYGGDVGKYFTGESGLEHSRSSGIRAMRPGPSKDLNPVYYFLMDEPDAHDFAVTQLPPEQRLGTLGQDVVRTSREFREADPSTPQLLNVDNTYKPENWYMYAQLPDVYCADPYFQSQQQIVWSRKPAWAASFLKPTYVLGVATICNWACAPKPLHIILNAVEHGSGAEGFRYATPEEKTVELFYALGGGAKALSYWWYTPYGEFRGCGANDKAAVALWRQIGLLGAQTRTAGPILTRSCPATLSMKTPVKLWTRTLLAGSDTILLLAVNDNIASDRLGTVVVPLPKTELNIARPNWLAVTNVFEITPDSIHDVSWKASEAEIHMSLGETRIARMIVITADEALRPRLEKLQHTMNLDSGENRSTQK